MLQSIDLRAFGFRCVPSFALSLGGFREGQPPFRRVLKHAQVTCIDVSSRGRAVVSFFLGNGHPHTEDDQSELKQFSMFTVAIEFAGLAVGSS